MPRYAQSSRDAIEAIQRRETFDTYGNLCGRDYTGDGASPFYYGQNRGIAKERFQVNARQIDYIAYSYSTPIAWHTTDGRWTYVARRFSASTDKAQSAVRAALSRTLHTELQPRYYLTERQKELLYYARIETGNVIDGKRTAKSVMLLVEKGLARLVPESNTFELTDAGKDYFA